MPKPDRPLKWGETAFDFMDREELLLFSKRAFSALQSAQSVIRLSTLRDPTSPFWTAPGGTGRLALAKVNMTIEAIVPEDEYDLANEMFRSYFRYADQVLFPDLADSPHHIWWINSDGVMIGGPPSPGLMDGCGWKDDFRIMTAEDLDPSHHEE